MENFELAQIISTATDLVLLLFILIYFFHLRSREKRLNQKENQIDTSFHKIVDDALSRERKIIEDTTQEAEQIISGAKYLSNETKQSLDQTLAKMVQVMEQGVTQTSQEFIKYYFDSLNHITGQSLVNFQNTTKQLEENMTIQIKQFQETMMPSIQKELELYKKQKMAEADKVVKVIVQKASREVLNKTINIDDHEKLIVDTLEKAKAEGVFD
jgi:hypothetical protein